MREDLPTELPLHRIAPFQVGDWLVQPAVVSVERDGMGRHLEPKVMQVLAYLARHPGEVLAKAQIIDAIWGDVFVAEGVLVRSVSELRRILEDDAKNPRYIETIPKTGYRLIAPVSLDVKIPDVKISDVETPDVGIPDVEIPDVETPDVEIPQSRFGAFRTLTAIATVGLLFGLYALWLRQPEPPRAETSPSVEPMSADFSAAGLHQRGRQYFHRHHAADNENAIELFKRALELDPDFAPAYAGLAEAYAFKVIRYAEGTRWSVSALDAARQSVRLAPDSGPAHQALGVALLVYGSERQARETLHQAVDLGAGPSAAHYLGMAYTAAGQLDTSMSWHRKALGLGNANAWQLARTGLVFRLLGDLQRAESWLRRSLEREPFQIEARLALAELALVEGDVIAARHSLKEFLTVQPGHAPALTLWARTERVGNDPRVAASLCRRALAASPGAPDPDARLLLASILVEGEHDDEGQRLLDALIEEQQDRLNVGSEQWEPYLVLAGVHAVRAESEAALEALRAAVGAGFRDYLALAADPVFATLQAEPGFRQLLSDLEARVGEMRRRVDNP
jgi:transcriptional activator of cad operon